MVPQQRLLLEVAHEVGYAGIPADSFLDADGGFAGHAGRYGYLSTDLGQVDA
jgi:hypothetical protein